MRKKLVFIVVGAALLSSAYANTKVKKSDDKMLNGYSFFYDETVDDFALGLDFSRSKDFEFIVDFSADSNRSVSTGNYNEYYVGLIAGLKKELKGDVSFGYGILANYGFYGNKANAAASNKTKEPYTIGPYISLIYSPNEHFDIFCRVMPVSYERNDENKIEVEAFQEGHFGIKYHF